MATVTGDQIVQEAQKFLGDPYVYGSEGPNTFDCSGLVQYVFGKLGISVPRTSELQYTAGTAVQEKDLQPGDLVFSAGSDGTTSSPGHVGIFAGVMPVPGAGRQSAPMVIEAPHTGDVVKYLPLSEFQAVGYRRMTGDSGGSSSGGGGGGIVNGVLGALGLSSALSLPDELLKPVEQWGKNLTSNLDLVNAFFRPSTYVRLGAGALGGVLLVAGLVFLVMSASKGA